MLHRLSSGKKTSCKGVIQKQNLVYVDSFYSVLDTKETLHVVNTGFKVLDHHIVTYKQKKRGLSYQYIKRKICEDGVSTVKKKKIQETK